MFKIIMIFMVLVFLTLGALYFSLRGIVSGSKSGNSSTKKEVGKNAKEIVTNILGEEMDEEDIGYYDVEIEYDGRTVTFDDVVVNRYGVFIIDGRNYKGTLYGSESDEIWIKKIDPKSRDGEEIRNPITQIKRKVEIMTDFLIDNGFSVWVDGYVFLANKNSPVESQYVLWDRQDIEYAIHPESKYQLSQKQVSMIERLIE